jgi:murein DD-endopeptidase MepM/ murein hydrolase activator NlpD
MKAIALSIATLASVPGAKAPAWTMALEPAVQWQPMDVSELDEAMPELDESLADLPEHGIEDEIAFEGCELSIGGELTPDAWSRELWIGAPLPVPVENGHTDKQGHWVAYDQIPRRPERSDKYIAYRYPVLDAKVVSGYDLDKPDEEQRRGKMHAVGHGGMDIVAPMGTSIPMIRLDHQVGDAEVIYVGHFYGNTVITRHTIREGGANHDYVLLFGHLDRPGDDVRRGTHLREGDTVGYVGNSDSPDLVHLHLEARRMREHVDAWRVPYYELLERDRSVVTDPRNVLVLRAPPMRAARCTLHPARRARTYWLGSEMRLSLE